MHKEFTEFCSHLEKWTLAIGRDTKSRVRVEPKASGKSIVQVLKRIPGLNIIEAATPIGSKVERVHAITAELEAGKVLIPWDDDAKYGGTWIQNFIAECEAFPRGKHDEQVDELCGIMDNRNVVQKLAYR